MAEQSLPPGAQCQRDAHCHSGPRAERLRSDEHGCCSFARCHRCCRRAGVSIRVPEPYSTRLTRARVDAGDPLAQSVPPHITLVPPTDVQAEDLARVEHHLQTVAAHHAPFVVDLSGTATFWPISPVVF